MQELLSSIRKNATGLAIFAVVTAGAIAATKIATEDLIAENILKAKTAALNEIVPESDYSNDLLNDTIELASVSDIHLLGPIADDAIAYRARTSNNSAAHTILLPVSAPDGYTTKIDLIVGIKADGSLAGVRVIDHKETPGLGDKIDIKKTDWVLSFNGKSLTSPDATINGWAVKKDGGEFDQFSGATITPRAVVNAVKRSLDFFANNKTLLLDVTSVSTADTRREKEE